MPAVARPLAALALALLVGACAKSEPEPAARPEPEAERTAERPAPATPDEAPAAPAAADTPEDGRRTAPRGTRTPGTAAPQTPTGDATDRGEPAGGDTEPVTAPPDGDEGEADDDEDDAPPSAGDGQSELRPPPKGLEILPNNHWRIPRRLADRWEENPYRLASPKELDEGWRLRRVRPGGPGWWLGLRNGDVILEVNGMKLNTKPQLIAAYLKLKNKTDFDVKIRRDGQIRIHHYKIVD